MRRVLTLIVGISLSVLILVFLFRDVDFAVFERQFRQFQPLVALPLFLIFIATLYLRALRWRLLLPAQYRAELSTRDLMDASTIGFAASAVLPLRAGEIIRPLFLRKLSGVPFASGFASIFTERVFDLIALLAVAWFALSNVKSAPESMVTTGRALGAIAFLGVAGLMLCMLAGGWTMRLAEKIAPKILPHGISAKLLELLHQVVAVLSALKSVGEVALVLFYSLLIWLGLAFYYQVSLHLFGEGGSFLVGMVLTSTIAFAVAAPSSPGFVGTYQAGCVLALTTVYGYSKEFSLAYGIGVHLTQTVSLLLYAAVVLWLRDIRLGTLLTADKDKGPGADPGAASENALSAESGI